MAIVRHISQRLFGGNSSRVFTVEQGSSQLVEGGLAASTLAPPSDVRYLEPDEIQKAARKLFESMHEFFDENHNKPYATDYDFADTTLGGPLLDFGDISQRRLGGDVNSEVYWDHSDDIDNVMSASDRSWWGTLVAAVLDEWKVRRRERLSSFFSFGRACLCFSRWLLARSLPHATTPLMPFLCSHA